MKIRSEQFRVRDGAEVDLGKWPTRIDPVYKSKEQYHELLGEHVAQLSEQQQLLYASNRYAVLLIFQAMDAAGKDGAIKHVMSGVNPQGCQVFSFKHPTPAELQHDFLWRTTRDLPERGQIGIFNRSYYEEVLIARVHPEILRSEGLPDAPRDEKAVWRERYRSIVDLERHLTRNGTRIVKFHLHLSKGEQRKRFLERIDDPDKNWKFSAADITERKFWKQYMKAYEQCLHATSTSDAPWYVVPADDKNNARLIVSRIVLDTLAGLKMAYPRTSAQHRRELLAIRKRLAR
jgi:PPK2 family polyphosphate:nucleotide phosphotransferase